MDVFDMARLRLQAPVRRPNSRKMEPRNLQRIHDSLQLKHAGNRRLPVARDCKAAFFVFGCVQACDGVMFVRQTQSPG